MKKFRLFWRDGRTEDVEGTDITDALNSAGIGQGALPALDHWEPLS